MSRTLSLHRQLSAVLCGGFCGTITRYWLSQWIQAHMGKAWPYDIFLINITGAMVLAFITTLADKTFLIGPTRRLFINVGFLGAYTTFSSLALGDVQLATAGHWLSAMSYPFLSLAVGILAVLCGKALGQWVVDRRKALSVAEPSLQKFAMQEDRLLDSEDDQYEMERSC